MSSTTDYGSKIIQYEPAWALHAYLRFIDMPYSCEFSPSEASLGFSSLPIVVTKVMDGPKIKVFPEREGFEALQSIHADTSQCPYLRQLDEKASSYLRHTVIALSKQIRRLEYKKTLSQLSPFGIHYVHNCLFDIREYFNRGRFDAYPDANKASLVAKVVQCYASLNSILDGKESTPFMYALEAATLQEGAEAIGLSYFIPEIASRSATRGISDAQLFESIADALQDEILAPLVVEQANIMKYFGVICRSYFFSGTVSTYKHKLWQVVVQDLVDRYLPSNSPSSFGEHLRELLTANHSLPVDVSLVVGDTDLLLLDSTEVVPFPTATTTSTSTTTTTTTTYASSGTTRFTRNTLSYSNIYGDGEPTLKSYSADDAEDDAMNKAIEEVIRSSEEQDAFLLATVSEEAWKVRDDPPVLVRLDEIFRFQRPNDLSSIMRVAFISSVGVSFINYIIRLC